MRQDLADLRGHERALPGGAKSRARQSHWPCRVIEQRDADFAAQFGTDLLDRRAQALDEPGQGQLGAEHHLRVAWRAGPEEHVEPVIHKPGERAIAVLANHLTELGLGGGEPGDLLQAILRRQRLLEGARLLLGIHIARLAPGPLGTPVDIRAGIRLRDGGRLRLRLRVGECRAVEASGIVRHIQAGEGLLRIGIDLNHLPAGEEMAVIGAELPGLSAPGCRGRKQVARQCDRKANLRQGPVPTQEVVEGSGGVPGRTIANQAGYGGREGMLVFRQSLLDGPCPGIGDALVEEGLLPFEEELLVAQRAHSQPRQHQAGHKHRDHKYQCNFLHRLSVAVACWSNPATDPLGWRCLICSAAREVHLRVAGPGGAPTFLSACTRVAPARPHEQADKNVSAPASNSRVCPPGIGRSAIPSRSLGHSPNLPPMPAELVSRMRKCCKSLVMADTSFAPGHAEASSGPIQ